MAANNQLKKMVSIVRHFPPQFLFLYALKSQKMKKRMMKIVLGASKEGNEAKAKHKEINLKSILFIDNFVQYFKSVEHVFFDAKILRC